MITPLLTPDYPSPPSPSTSAPRTATTRCQISTLALPDLRGRAPVHFGAGPGLPSVELGEVGAAANLTGAAGNGGSYIGMNWIIALEGIYPSRG